jgi:N6-adenosine-specific RNA methylase IME4
MLVNETTSPANDLITAAGARRFGCILADPPWQFMNRTGKMAPEHKRLKDGGSDGRGVGFYFRNVTELVLFGVRGKNARTLQPGRTQVNYLGTRKREHSRKPDELYGIIEGCSPPSRIELFARGARRGWRVCGNQADENYVPTWDTYSHNSATDRDFFSAPAD